MGVNLSIIIPTFNRATLLRPCLESFARQTLAPGTFEVIVVDDGSVDVTREVCRDFETTLALRYLRVNHSGIAAAKNHGVRAATGSILLFADDDNIVDEELCREHVEVHARNPEPHIAVLGYATWAPWLRVTEVMKYVTEVGGFLFAYRHLGHG